MSRHGWTGGRVVAQTDQQVPDPLLERAGEAAGGHHRLDGRRTKGADQELFLSPRTIDMRVRDVLIKLGCR